MEVPKEMSSKNQFRFKDAEERFIRTNRFGFLCTLGLFGVSIIYLALSLAVSDLGSKRGGYIVMIVIILAAIVTNLVSYRFFSKTSKYRLILAVTTVVVFLMVGFWTPASFIHWGLIGILMVGIPYYDVKYTKGMTIFYGVVLLINIAFRHMVKISNYGDVNGICEVVMIFCVILVLFLSCKIGTQFNVDMMGFMNLQKEEQQGMLNDIINISKTVNEETVKGNQYVQALYESTQTVHRSMQEISSATEMTAENVQDQNTMTQEIQSAIEETVSRSKTIVTVAQESNDNIRENIKAMDELKEQSENIAETNTHVNDSMHKLQEKTKEVEQIAGMIFSISSQTNLLALNASIESARAGEAGRGFAVVAEQIRQLAEQTRVSTENITKIINELNTNAEEVVAAVDNSTTATDKQHEMIRMAAENFEKLDKNITSLIGGIHEIDDKISNLYEANNKIVENISHLSATTEEITASAEQAQELSQNNLQSAQEAKDTLAAIKSTSEGMEKYF